jgi:hypothetical protein
MFPCGIPSGIGSRNLIAVKYELKISPFRLIYVL